MSLHKIFFETDLLPLALQNNVIIINEFHTLQSRGWSRQIFRKDMSKSPSLTGLHLS